jgi:hypothetical protein
MVVAMSVERCNLPIGAKAPMLSLGKTAKSSWLTLGSRTTGLVIILEELAWPGIFFDNMCRPE